MKWRWWRTADEKAADFVADREPQNDEQFCMECGLPTSTDAIRMALAVRRSVASYGSVAAEFVRADDRYPEELGRLSEWDSLDILAWILELERELGGEKISSTAFEDLRPPFAVKDLVWMLYSYLGTADTH